ncbi:hypothetical protein BJ997_001025 [Cryobacterium roopkundense]|uniref:Uncharacterized protein n=1 Tax=Cryobacterium roopkundense TaxID=1001240 RepID=A0A7W9E2D0_9MICO|nr:hypothetical protein [Cryobacterium roopkundense]
MVGIEPLIDAVSTNYTTRRDVTSVYVRPMPKVDASQGEGAAFNELESRSAARVSPPLALSPSPGSAASGERYCFFETSGT